MISCFSFEKEAQCQANAVVGEEGCNLLLLSSFILLFCLMMMGDIKIRVGFCS